MARIAAGLVAAAGWVGLAVQFAATREQGFSTPATLWILARYFTILANLMVASTLTARAAGVAVSPRLLGGAALAILLVGVVYITLLRGLLELSGGALLADRLLHYVTPLLVPLWWAVFAPKGRLKWIDPALWALFPLAYLPYALARGAAEGVYAYPFLNVGRLGGATVALYATAIAVAFLLAGAALVVIDRRLARH
ncbi:Pr6Pr family membrane protein [Sphingomonas sp. ASV193]|uniref:Pr6Pr family membrane protein n=1 Tax=Sphingomonas sp. ASV193 TaxID=3144405 RepID=UPI0032E8E1C6